MASHAEIRVGISGWRHAPWRGAFYPLALKQDKELEYASRQVNTIEINGTFYSLQNPNVFARLYAATLKDFVFSAKRGRYITHIRRLKDVEEPVNKFFNLGVLELKEKLGPVLWQFPPSIKYDHDRFKNFIDLLPPQLRYAIEVRNESFRNPEFFKLLKHCGIALVFSDSAGRWPYFEEDAADFIYIRLYGGEGKLYSGGYGNRSLSGWAVRIRRWISERPLHDVFVYFDNDMKVKALFDAISLIRRTSEYRKAA